MNKTSPKRRGSDSEVYKTPPRKDIHFSTQPNIKSPNSRAKFMAESPDTPKYFDDLLKTDSVKPDTAFLKQIRKLQAKSKIMKKNESKKVNNKKGLDVAISIKRKPQKQQQIKSLQEMAQEEVDKAEKRKREQTPPFQTPTDTRPKKGSRVEHSPDVQRKLSYSSEDDEETKEELKLERKAKEHNAKIKNRYTKMINEHSYLTNGKLRKLIEAEFAQTVDFRKGKDYFKSDVPQPKDYGRTDESKKLYRKDLLGWLDGIFI